MQRDISDAVVILEPSPERRGEVARLLFSSHADRGYAPATLGADADAALRSCLLEARRGDRTVGAVWGRSWADGVTQVVRPWIAPDESTNTSHLLLRKLDEHMVAHGVRVAFAYAPIGESRSLTSFTENGYLRAGEMLVLACEAGADRRAPFDDSLSFRRYQQSCQRQLRALIKNTHEGSLDFPDLIEVHQTDDILARYADAGDSGTEHWWFVQSAGCHIGCLLLADHRDHDQCELVYMGLVPEARGNGWGRQIVAQALHAVAELGRRRVVLGVDIENDPAITIYARSGFVEQHRRSVLSKHLRADGVR